MAVDDRRTATWLNYDGGRATSMHVRRCRLTVLSGVDVNKVAEVESTLMRVGARESCDLVLTDARVSGFHFEIRLDEFGYRLLDLGSSNGTTVSGLRVREAYLEPGMIIHVGDSRIRFEPQDSTVPVKLSDVTSYGELIGQAPSMRALFAKLERIAPSDASVLVHGETGVGKELVAEAIHRGSGRSHGPFIVVDCGSIPSNLISSELFGHEKGAFTGATSRHEGAFERAHGGTLFLDEIGELPIDLQPSLLGALERKRIRRVGGRRDVPIDIRVIAATHRDLPRAINQARFREDLYYRLAVIQLTVPSMRERLEDVPLLVSHFLKQLPGGDSVTLKQRTIDNLCRYDYPGNVRELRNLIERAVIMHDSEHTQNLVSVSGASPQPAGAPSGDLVQTIIDTRVPFKQAKRDMMDEFEKRFLRKLLRDHEGNISKAARSTGVDRMTIHKMVQKYGLAKR